jgi:phosphatidylinositol alpha-mannosyltransferase
MVCPYSLSRPGGVQGQAEGLARALGALGVDVHLVAPSDDRPPGLHGTTFVAGRATALRSNGSVAPVSLSPAASLRALRFTRDADVDLVHLHEPMAPGLGYACLARSRVPLVGTYHRSGDSSWYRLMGPLARWANDRLAARCAVSKSAADTARAAMGGDYEVLFNGVEVERFASERPAAAGRPAVLFLGRHEERKGLGVLLEAFAGVTTDAVLWVAGDGPATAGLRRRFPPSSRIEWLGTISEDEKRARLGAAGVLCAPSLGSESFGVVLLEAMAAGCAVVASDLPGYRGASGGLAALVAPGDPVALAGALDRALADVRLGTGLAAPAALRRAVAHARGWSMERLAAHYHQIYERVLSQGRCGPGTTLGRP